MFSGDLLNIEYDAAFAAVLVGFVLFLAVLAALGISMWRHANQLSSSQRDREPIAGLVATRGSEFDHGTTSRAESDEMGARIGAGKLFDHQREI